MVSLLTGSVKHKRAFEQGQKNVGFTSSYTSAKSHSGICFPLNILWEPMILFVDSEGPDQTAGMGRHMPEDTLSHDATQRITSQQQPQNIALVKMLFFQSKNVDFFFLISP